MKKLVLEVYHIKDKKPKENQYCLYWGGPWSERWRLGHWRSDIEHFYPYSVKKVTLLENGEIPYVEPRMLGRYIWAKLPFYQPFGVNNEYSD